MERNEGGEVQRMGKKDKSMTQGSVRTSLGIGSSCSSHGDMWKETRGVNMQRMGTEGHIDNSG